MTDLKIFNFVFEFLNNIFLRKQIEARAVHNKISITSLILISLFYLFYWYSF